MRPVELACFGIEAVEVSGKIAHEEQPLGGDGYGGKATVDFVVRPDLSGLGDIAGLGCVDASNNPDAFAMLRILTDRGVDPILPEHRGSIDLTGTLRIGILEFFALGWVAVVPP